MDTNGHTILCEDYCSFEVAKLLKEKGFDEPCFYYYKDKVLIFSHSLKGRNSYQTDTCSVPTLQMAMKWLREVHKVFISIDAYTANHLDGYIDTFEIDIFKNASRIMVPREIAIHNIYEEAVEAAIKYSLENLI